VLFVHGDGSGHMAAWHSNEGIDVPLRDPVLKNTVLVCNVLSGLRFV
jgi:hypothetical protein